METPWVSTPRMSAFTSTSVARTLSESLTPIFLKTLATVSRSGASWTMTASASLTLNCSSTSTPPHVGAGQIFRLESAESLVG